MRQSELLKSYATKLRLYNLNTYMDDIVHKAQEDRPSYLDFLLQVLEKEVVSCISPTAMSAYNKMLRANLIAIDDIMLFPVRKQDAAGFFNRINALHEKTSIIIITNKAPTEWAQTLDDEILATALLDRLLYRCEVVKLTRTIG